MTYNNLIRNYTQANYMYPPNMAANNCGEYLDPKPAYFFDKVEMPPIQPDLCQYANSPCPPAQKCCPKKCKKNKQCIHPVKTIFVPVVYTPASPCTQPWAKYPYFINSYRENITF